LVKAKDKIEVDVKQKTGFLQSFLNSTGNTAGIVLGIFVGIIFVVLVLALLIGSFGFLTNYKTGAQQSAEYRENYLAPAGTGVEINSQYPSQSQNTVIGQEGYPCKKSGDCASGFCCGGYVMQTGPNAGYATCRAIGKSTCFP